MNQKQGEITHAKHEQFYSTVFSVHPTLLAAGAVGPLLFILVFLIEGATRPGYSAWQTDVSYLALSNQGWEQIANFLICGSLCIAFAVGLRQIWRTGRGFGLGAAAGRLVRAGPPDRRVCVTDPGGGYPPGAPINGSPSTWHGWVHGINGGLLFNVVLPAACFVLSRRFAADPQHRRWATYSWLTGALILVISIPQHHWSAVRREGRVPRGGRSFPESRDYHGMGLDSADRPAPVAGGPQGQVRGSLYSHRRNLCHRRLRIVATLLPA